ncbi:MAG: hypothetical protein NHB32_29440 [Fischerella sp. CENA71]|nr:hypothetical protein [Fischerella sp. CENA71]
MSLFLNASVSKGERREKFVGAIATSRKGAEVSSVSVAPRASEAQSFGGSAER